MDDVLQMDLAVPERTWTPTAHGQLLAETLASHDLVSGRDVLELGAGAGNHTIVMVRRGARSIVATELDANQIDVTQRNVEKNCDRAGIVSYRVADWVHVDGEYDALVTNPPFARSGKRNRRYFIDMLILESHKRLRPGGELIFVQSSMADLPKTLRRLEENGFRARVIAENSGPFRDYYLSDPEFLDEIERVPDGYREIDGTKYEKLFVVHAQLTGARLFG